MVGSRGLNLLRVNLLLALEVLNSLNTSQAKCLVDTLHASTVSLGNALLLAAKEDIELLQSLILGLRGEPPDEQTTQTTENGEENVSSVLHGVQHILGGQTNDEVEHPVGGGDDGDTAGTLAVGEDFLGQDPCDGTYKNRDD